MSPSQQHSCCAVSHTSTMLVCSSCFFFSLLIVIALDIYIDENGCTKTLNQNVCPTSFFPAIIAGELAGTHTETNLLTYLFSTVATTYW